jgi:hypothetical protein
MPDADRVVSELAEKVARQDALHPDGYPATRDGVLLGIAAAGVELIEAGIAWFAARCKCPTPRCGHADWGPAADEMLDAAAVLVRAVREVRSAVPTPPAGGSK